MDDLCEILPLTPPQASMLYNMLAHPESSLYTEQWRYRLHGVIDSAALRRAWEMVLHQHPTLRGVFRLAGLERPVFVVQKRAPACFTLLDCSSTDLDALAQTLYSRPVRLSRCPIRMSAAVTGPCSCELIVDSNNLLFDGWSNAILMRDFFESYLALTGQKEPHTLPIDPGLAVYLQQERLERARPAHAAFWRTYLSGISLTTISRSKAGPLSTMTFSFSRGLLDSLHHFCQMYSFQKALVLHIAFALALGTPSAGDLLTGITCAGRHLTGVPSIEQLVGPLIRTVPLRIPIHSGGSILQVLRQVHDGFQQVQKHLYLDLAFWHQILPGLPEIFESLFTIQNYPLDPLFFQKTDTTLEFLGARYESANALSASYMPQRQGDIVEFRLRTPPWHAADVTALFGRLEQVLRHLVTCVPERDSIHSLCRSIHP